MSEILVTAMIVVRNEEKYIKISLKSLLEQDFPEDKYEIIIIDGNSTDNTLKNIQNILKQYKRKVKVTILENEKKLLAPGWNIGIQNAKGIYVTRIDAHAKASKDFLKKSLETIESLPEDVACVGGRLTSVSLEKEDKTISKVLSSPFGIGNSKFRYADKPQYTDTVAFGMYKKEVFEKVGYFDETLERNQDNNMHNRIRKAGFKFYFNPEIKSEYYVRNNLKKMLKQGFSNGKWNIIVFKQDRGALSLRHLVPLFFVLSIIVMTILSFVNKIFFYIFLAEIVLYLFLGLIFAIKKTKNIFETLKMILYFFLLHISYGTGSLISIFYKRKRKEERK